MRLQRCRWARAIWSSCAGVAYLAQAGEEQQNEYDVRILIFRPTFANASEAFRYLSRKRNLGMRGYL
jgi:hypothetical protein